MFHHWKSASSKNTEFWTCNHSDVSKGKNGNNYSKKTRKIEAILLKSTMNQATIVMQN